MREDDEDGREDWQPEMAWLLNRAMGEQARLFRTEMLPASRGYRLSKKVGRQILLIIHVVKNFSKILSRAAAALPCVRRLFIKI